MVSSGILEHGMPGKFRNNDKIGSDIEFNPERHKFDFTKKLIWYWEANMNNGIKTSSEY